MANNLKRAMDTDLSRLHLTERKQAEIYQNILEGHTVRKKLSAAFLTAIILILLAATALAVGALTGHLRFMKPDEGPQALSCTVMDDTLYMMTNRGLMAWQPAQDEPVSLTDDQHMMAQGLSIDALLFHTDELMLLNPDTMMIWRYHNGAFDKVLSLDGPAELFSNTWLSDPVAVDGALFVRAVENDKTDADAVLWRIDLATGKANPLPVKGIVELTAYRDGELLAVQFSQYDSKALLVLDAQSGEVLEQNASTKALEIRGIAYDADSSSIYAIYHGTLSQWKNGQWNPLQTVSIPPRSFFFGTIGGGYVAAGYSGVQFVSFGAEETAQALVIRGWPSPLGAEDAFVQTNPGVQIQRENQASFNGTDVAAALRAGEDVDLFYVRLDAAVASLLQNGQLAPLSQSAVLAADFDQLLPLVQAAVAPTGTLYAVSDQLWIPLWMIRNDAVTAPPRTLYELLEQDIAWNAQHSPEGMYVANDYNTAPWSKDSYARYALQQAYFEAAAIGQVPDFSSSEFTVFLKRLKSAVLSAAEQPMQSSVVTANSSFTLRGRTNDDPCLQWHIMNPPAVMVSQTDTLPATVLVYVLNPNSKNQQLALQFLEYAAQHRSAEEQALLSPGAAEPSLYAYAQAYESLQSLPESWEVTQTALAAYQMDIVPRLSLSLYPYTANQGQLLETVMQYLHDGITLEQCTQRLAALAAEAATE